MPSTSVKIGPALKSDDENEKYDKFLPNLVFRHSKQFTITRVKYAIVSDHVLVWTMKISHL